MPGRLKRVRRIPVRKSLRARVVPRANVVDLRKGPSVAPRPVVPPPVDRRPVDLPALFGRLARPLPPLTRARFAFHLYDLRSVSGFVVAAVLVVALLSVARATFAAQGNATVAIALANSGATQLQRAGQALAAFRWHDANTAAAQATEAFRDASAALRRVPLPVRLGLPVAPALNARYASARHLASAGERFGTALGQVASFGERTLGGAPGGAGWLAALLPVAQELAPAITAAEQGVEELAGVVPTAFSEPTRTALTRTVEVLPLARRLLGEARAGVTLLPGLLGAEKSREYLVVFQNAAERRPTGGFWGSILGVRFDNGVPTITDAPGRGPYEVDDLLPAVAPPNPILRVTNRWTLHDANWSSAFPESAAQGLAFYEEARGFSVDGVLAFTSTLLPRLLAATGPIALPDGTVLTTENALSVLQRRVELGFDRSANQPKAVMAQLFTVLSERFLALPPEELGRIAAVLRDGTTTREVQLFVKDPKLQTRVESALWGGTLEPGPFDTVGVIGANLGGGKTDRVTDDSLTVAVSIDRSGQVRDTLTYIRTHRGVPADPLEGFTNRSYLRFLAPPGARLTAASGFTEPDPAGFFAQAAGARPDPNTAAYNAASPGIGATRVGTEGPFTAFGGWLDVPARQTKAVRVGYELSQPLEPEGFLAPTRTYRLRLLHQSGTQPTVLLRIALPTRARILASSLPLTVRQGAFEGSLVLTQDQDITVLYR